MVRRNPYKKKRRENKEGSNPESKKARKEEQKKRETYADLMPGVVFFLCSKQSI